MRCTILASISLIAVGALNPIIIKGSKFFDAVTRQQFFIKGLAYQPQFGGMHDPLADVEGCKRDIPNFKRLGINTIRVYEAYSHLNHDTCMNLLKEAGIYLILDLPISTKSINREWPSYDTEIKKLYLDKVDSFSKYPNLLAFIAGNEVTNDLKTTKVSAYIKAVLRDTKVYIKSKGLNIPVGYADNDDDNIRLNIQSFFNCGEDHERADFYAINTYRWCGESSFTTSGYDRLTKELASLDTPTFLSEFGCNQPKPRKFTEIQSIFGSDMQGSVSGGVVYEYTQEINKFGLVVVEANGLQELPDFNAVVQQMSSVHPQGITMDQYNPTNAKKVCPQVSDKWQSGAKLPPTPDDQKCRQVLNSLECRLSSRGRDPQNGQGVGEQIGWLCGNGLCNEIVSDPATGNFGEYSMCTPAVKNAYVFNKAYKQGYPCDFNGFATLSRDEPVVQDPVTIITPPTPTPSHPGNEPAVSSSLPSSPSGSSSQLPTTPSHSKSNCRPHPSSPVVPSGTPNPSPVVSDTPVASLHPSITPSATPDHLISDNTTTNSHATPTTSLPLLFSILLSLLALTP